MSPTTTSTSTRSRPANAPRGRRRLLRHRHHAADHRRVAVRGRRCRAPASGCSTSPPATATPRSPRLAVALPSRRPTTSRLLDRRAPAPPPKGWRRVREADAETLPFADGTFDVVLSTFGVMFAPKQERRRRRAAPGVPARAAASASPTGHRRLRRRDVHDRRPIRAAAARPAFTARMGHATSSPRAARPRRVVAHDHTARPRLPVSLARHWLDAFRTQYGPVLKTFAALDPAGRDKLDGELIALATAHDTSTTDGLRIPSDYVEVIAVRSAFADASKVVKPEPRRTVPTRSPKIPRDPPA